MRLFVILAAALSSGSTFLPQSQAERPLPFSDTGWEISGERSTVVKHDGRDVFQVETGFAHRRDVKFENGTIDFDVQLTSRRSFVYVYFRTVANGEREEFYLRPHKSQLPDALQYAPVWQNRSAWQLHHGPGGTASIEFEPGVWTHVRVVVRGQQAALFIKDMAKPALLVPQLSRPPQAGHVAVGGFLPAGVPGEGPIARFSSVVVKPDVVAFDFAAAIAALPRVAPAPVEGIVRAWSVSQAFLPKEGAVPTLPPAEVLGTFQRLETEPDGLLQLHRHVRVAEKTSLSAAVARVRVRAAQPGDYAFDLGFSDIATVFVNGRVVFRGDGTYSFDRPRREGLIGFDNARLYLPLTAGDNEVSVLVTDTFGGWGIMGRFVGSGVEIRD